MLPAIALATTLSTTSPQPYLADAGIRPRSQTTSKVTGATEYPVLRVKVVAGDTIYELARAHGSTWQAVATYNPSVVDPSVIFPGQVLTVPVDDKSTTYVPKHAKPAGEYVPQHAAPVSGDVNLSDYSGFQQCVIEAESGGNPNVMNSTGHYGLYQFSLSTWEEYGGSAATFGDATVAEQNQVFANAIAAGGEDNWAPYDGC